MDSAAPDELQPSRPQHLIRSIPETFFILFLFPLFLYSSFDMHAVYGMTRHGTAHMSNSIHRALGNITIPRSGIQVDPHCDFVTPLHVFD